MSAAYRDTLSRQGLIVFACAIAIVLVGWLLFWPAYTGWRERERELASARSELASKQATLDSFSRLIANYESKASELEVLGTSLPNAPKVPQLITNLEDLAVRSGMRVQSIRITDPTKMEESYKTPSASGSDVEQGIPNPVLVELKIEMNLEGDYGSLRGFLEALERNQRLLEVRSIAASPLSGTDQSSGAVFGLVLGTSYQK